METINMKYDLKIEVLTPLSIGAGAEKDWVKGVDFVVNKGKIYKLNLKKIVKEGVNIDRLTSFFASKNEQGIINLITEPKLEKVSDFVMPLPADSPNDIKAFVKNQLTGKPILAGSSLKGAIRSILFDYLRDSELDEKQVFGSSVKGDEFMRFIKISDAEFDGTSLVNTKIFNLRRNNGLWCGGWKHKGLTNGTFKQEEFNTIYEALMPSDVGCASFMVSNQFLEVDWRRFYDQWQRETRKDAEKETIKHLIAKVESKKTLLRNENSLNTFFKVINNHTKEYLEKEKTFFEKYSANKTDLIIASIDKLLNLIPSDNSYCILKMSAGSGFHSITGDWQFDDYSNGQLDRKRAEKKDLKTAGEILPKSRKIAVYGEHFDLMGFVKLTAISEEEKEKERLEREALAREQAEKERKQREEQERLENELKKKEEEYTRFYKLAEEACSAEQWSEVLQHIESAVCIFPDRSSQFDSLKSIANEYIKLQEQQKAIDEAKQKEDEERKIANSVPLAEKIAGASKIPTLCGSVKQWMKYNKLEELTEDDKVVLKSKLLDLGKSQKEKEVKKQMNSAIKDLILILGQDLAQQWFDEIVKG
jgi:CRISPR/Cas system CSM-associated protein Csm5 (group 7 of RAMP superfamily)